ncbi:hypothetical protein L3i20_v242840 [Paenibacillus sp. L3-i20]|nr:hypothetical protein L3i20_v242840 [Paenibacillus sp. L3-i20]
MSEMETIAIPRRIFGGNVSRFNITTRPRENAAIMKIIVDEFGSMFVKQPPIVNYAKNSIVMFATPCYNSFT